MFNFYSPESLINFHAFLCVERNIGIGKTSFYVFTAKHKISFLGFIFNNTFTALFQQPKRRLCGKQSKSFKVLLYWINHEQTSQSKILLAWDAILKHLHFLDWNRQFFVIGKSNIITMLIVFLVRVSLIFIMHGQNAEPYQKLWWNSGTDRLRNCIFLTNFRNWTPSNSFNP